MMVRKPDDGGAEVAERIRAESGDYITSAEEIAAQQAEIHKRADEYRQAVKDIRSGEDPTKNRKGGAPKELKRNKRFQPPTGKSKDESGKKSKEEEAGE